MATARKRHLGAATWIRQRRLALGRTAQDVGRAAGFSTSKTLRIERGPERARLGDVLLLEETLERLEPAAAANPDFHSALISALERRSELLPFGKKKGGR
jgi:predicted transcriptional regulator